MIRTVIGNCVSGVQSQIRCDLQEIFDVLGSVIVGGLVTGNKFSLLRSLNSHISMW